MVNQHLALKIVTVNQQCKRNATAASNNYRHRAHGDEWLVAPTWTFEARQQQISADLSSCACSIAVAVATATALRLASWLLQPLHQPCNPSHSLAALLKAERGCSTPHLLQTLVAGCAISGTGTAAVSAWDSCDVDLEQTLQKLWRPVGVSLSGQKAAAGRVAWHRLHRFSAGGCAGRIAAARCLSYTALHVLHSHLSSSRGGKNCGGSVPPHVRNFRSRSAANSPSTCSSALHRPPASGSSDCNNAFSLNLVHARNVSAAREVTPQHDHKRRCLRTDHFPAAMWEYATQEENDAGSCAVMCPRAARQCGPGQRGREPHCSTVMPAFLCRFIKVCR